MDDNETNYDLVEELSDKSELKRHYEIAFGLQKVDNLTPSNYMMDLANENINGKKTYNEVENELKKYYNKVTNINRDEQEADKVSLHIVKLLNDKSFTFSVITLKEYHRILFEGVDLGISGKYYGEFRDVNITKQEPVLNGDSVIYSDYTAIYETLKYDFEEERNQNYLKMSEQQMIKRLATFTSRIWQVHPFREGNTRTTAVFIQKYLNSKGFNVNNDLFKENSLYFRNALVRNNCANYQKKIDDNDSYLIAFFENLLLGKNNILNNKDLYITERKNQLDNDFYDDYDGK